jgi:hypothetical protein
MRVFADEQRGLSHRRIGGTRVLTIDVACASPVGVRGGLYF